jgi:hypothetical protein
LKKALIIYYTEAEKGKVANEEKVAAELEKLFKKANFAVTKALLQTKKKMEMKLQLKMEKALELKEKAPQTASFDIVVVGSPIIGSLTSAPAVNSFLRQLPKSPKNQKTKFVLFSTGVIPGFANKKMQSLLSMKGANVIDSETFTSIFEFDNKKMQEVDKFYSRIIQKLTN